MQVAALSPPSHWSDQNRARYAFRIQALAAERVGPGEDLSDDTRCVGAALAGCGMALLSGIQWQFRAPNEDDMVAGNGGIGMEVTFAMPAVITKKIVTCRHHS